MHGMCRPHTDRHHREPAAAVADALSAARAALSGTPGRVAVAERRPDERLTDAEREQAADLLAAAFRDGVIGVDEFDQRLTAALNAQVAADLAVVTDDLPTQWVAEREAQERSQRRAAAHRRRWSAEVRAYAAVMALLVTIWLLTSLDGDLSYPWPVWPALGWGIPLFLSRPRRAAGRAPGGRQAARKF